MACKSCQSTNQRVFESEITIHFPQLKDVKRSPVVAFSDLVICLNCGFTETRVEDPELKALIVDQDNASGKS